MWWSNADKYIIVKRKKTENVKIFANKNLKNTARNPRLATDFP